jgi:ATP-binding cassette, subfamily B, multidrug efflux pump
MSRHRRAIASAGDPDDERKGSALDLQMLRRIWSFVRNHRKLLFGSLLLLPAAAGLQLLPPYLLKLSIDDAITPGKIEKLAPYALLLIGSLVLQQLCQFGHSLLMQICGHRSMHDLRVAGHKHLLQLRAAYFDRTPIGRTMTRVTNDVESIAEAFNAGLITIIGDIIALIGIVIAMFLLHPWLALLTLGVLPVLLVVVLTFQRALRNTHRRIRRRIARINATLQEHVTGMKVVQSLGIEPRAADTFDQVNRDHREAFRSAIRYDSLLFALVEMLGSITVAALIWYGGGAVLEGSTVTFGLLVAFIEYVQRFFIPIRDMSAKYAVMQQAMAASERVFELLDTNEPDAPDLDGPSIASPSVGSPDVKKTADITSHANPATETMIRFDDVRFAYTENTPILKGLSFAIRRGEHIAIVGATGGGKSTLVKLLTRLYEIGEGAIYLDGSPLQTIPRTELRRKVVSLSQDVFLFSGTILSNITLGDPGISENQAEAAAEQVGLNRLLNLDQEVLERGANLSAGERQLVVFARALVRKPDVLILDEATANVDPASEEVIQNGIAELLKSRTALVIAHRLTTIESVDRVFVLHHGELVEEGPHEKLLADDGLYAKLYRLQYIDE